MILRSRNLALLATLGLVGMGGTACNKKNGGGNSGSNPTAKAPDPGTPPAQAPAAAPGVPTPTPDTSTTNTGSPTAPQAGIADGLEVTGLFSLAIALEPEAGLADGKTKRVIVAVDADGNEFLSPIDDATGAYSIKAPAGIDLSIISKKLDATGAYAYEASITTKDEGGETSSTFFGAEGKIVAKVYFDEAKKLAVAAIDVAASTALDPEKLAEIKLKLKRDPTVFVKPLTGEWQASIKGQDDSFYAFGVPTGRVFFAQTGDTVRLFESKKIANACAVADGGAPKFSLNGVPVSFKDMASFESGLDSVYGSLGAGMKAEIESLLKRDLQWQKQSCSENPYIAANCKLVPEPAAVTGSYEDRIWNEDTGEVTSKTVSYSYPGNYELSQFDSLASVDAASTRTKPCNTWIEWSGDGAESAKVEKGRDWNQPWCSNSATNLDHATGLGTMTVYLDGAGTPLNLVCRVTQTVRYESSYEKPAYATAATGAVEGEKFADESAPATSYQYLIQNVAEGGTLANALAIYYRPECEVISGGVFDKRLRAEAQQARQIVRDIVQSKQWTKGQDVCARFKAPPKFTENGGFGQCAKMFAMNYGGGYAKPEPAPVAPAYPDQGVSTEAPAPKPEFLELQDEKHAFDKVSTAAPEPVGWEPVPEICWQAQNVMYNLGMKSVDGSAKLVQDTESAGSRYVPLEQGDAVCPVYFAAHQAQWYEVQDGYQACADEFAAATLDGQIEAIVGLNKQWASPLERLSCLAGNEVASAVNALTDSQCLPAYYMRWECDGPKGCAESMACEGSALKHGACYDDAGEFHGILVGQIGGAYTLKPRFNGAFEMTRVDVNTYVRYEFATEDKPNGGQASCTDTMTSSLQGHFSDESQDSFKSRFALNYASSCDGIEAGKVDEALASGGKAPEPQRAPMAAYAASASGSAMIAPEPKMSEPPMSGGTGGAATAATEPEPPMGLADEKAPEAPSAPPPDKASGAGERGEGGHFLSLSFDRILE